MLTLYLLFYGYPSDKIVIPATIILTIIGIMMAVKGIREDLAK